MNHEPKAAGALRTHAPQLIAVLLALLTLAVTASAGHKKKPPSKPIDLNRATLAQLEQVPGVGPATARSILKFRRESGPFTRVDDLLAVRGISRRRLAKIRPYVVVRSSESNGRRRTPHAEKKEPES